MDQPTLDRISDFLDANLPPDTGWVLHFAPAGKGVEVTTMRAVTNVNDDCIASAMRALYGHKPDTKDTISDAN